MRLLLNVSSLQAPLTGIGRYTLNLTSSLLKSGRVSEVTGFSAAGLLGPAEVERLLQSLDTEAKQSRSVSGDRSGLRALVASLPGARFAYRNMREFNLRRQFQQLREHVYWEPNYLIAHDDFASVVTLHDVSHLRYPEFHPATRIKEMGRVLPRTLSAATRLNVVSEFTCREVVEYFNPKQPIDIVPPGVGEEFFNVSADEVARCKEKFNLPHEFVLSVSTLEPRKNLARLVDAYEQLPEALREKYPLVLAGATGWHASPIENSLRRLVEKKQAIILGYVEQPMLPALYAAATLTAYVSVYEGFGMPIVESMAAGTPVLTSNVTSMPEVSGKYAALVPPDNVAEIASALEHCLSNPDRLISMSQAGVARAREFSWESAALKLFESLEMAKDAHG